MSSDAAPHFHVAIVPVRARDRRRADRIVRRYITRDLSKQRACSGHALQIVRGYASRESTADAAREVLYYTYHDGGTGLSADALYDAVDRGRRRKDGEYKRHAGKLPRLALFITLSIPRGLGLAASCACIDQSIGSAKTRCIGGRRCLAGPSRLDRGRVGRGGGAASADERAIR